MYLWGEKLKEYQEKTKNSIIPHVQLQFHFMSSIYCSKPAALIDT